MPRPKPKALTPGEIVAQYVIGINEGLQACHAKFSRSPVPLLRVPGGELVIKQSTMSSKDKDRLFAADTKTKETGEFTLTLQLEEESPEAWRLRLGDIKLVDADGNVVPFLPLSADDS